MNSSNEDSTIYNLNDEDLDGQEIDLKLSDKEYVSKFIEYVTNIFNKERGKSEAKKANLSDLKSTRIENSTIIQFPLIDQ